MSEPADKTAASSVGDRLRAARDRQGLTLQKVSEDLHLDVPVLEAMEDNRFRALGAPVYARGHLKKYATLLGLEVSGLLADYEAEHSGPVEPVFAPRSSELAVVEPAQPSGGRSWTIVATIVVVAVAGALAAWWHFGPRRQPIFAPQNNSPAAAAIPVASQPSIASEGPQPAAQAAAAQATASTARPAANGSPARLRLSFQASSWVEVYDAVGARLLFDERSANTARTIVGVPPFKVLLGNYSGVDLSFNGRSITIPERSRIGDTARFRVMPDGSAVSSWGGGP